MNGKIIALRLMGFSNFLVKSFNKNKRISYFLDNNIASKQIFYLLGKDNS